MMQKDDATYRANWLSVRSLLFTPALKSDHFIKAKEVGADCLIIDLEDAVAPDKKEQARISALSYLKQNFQDELLRGLRINNLATADGLRDILAILENKIYLDAIFLPKTESSHELKQLTELLEAHLPHIIFIPMIETACGLAAASTIAAMPRVAGLLLGGADFTADIGAELNWDSLFVARTQIIQAAACANIAVFDMPDLNFSDDKGLITETQAIKKLGFAGKSAIHPHQISIINQIFTPTDNEIIQAQKIVAALAANKGAVTVVDGKMIDKPVARSAQRILNIAKKIPK